MGKKQCLKKEECKNLKGWAEGMQEAILGKHVLPYTNSLELGWRVEEICLSTIQREYHFHISWRLKDHEEPMGPLHFYDPHAPQEPEVLTAEEALEKQARMDILDLVGVILVVRSMTNACTYFTISSSGYGIMLASCRKKNSSSGVAW